MIETSKKQSFELLPMNRKVQLTDAAPAGYGDIIPDEELVKRSLNGDDDAFGIIYERYRRPVYTVVCRIIIDPEEARDAMQEIFITVYRSLDCWQPQRARFLSWIYTIATNRAIDHWRVRRRRAEMQLPERAETLFVNASIHSGTAMDIDWNIERKERSAEVRHFLEDLPKPQKRYFILRYFSGLKLKEISEREKCKIGTVKSSLHRTTAILRRKIQIPGVRSQKPGEKP
jgi:RNA polymerase sigma-70 factor, ECF subfamily